MHTIPTKAVLSTVEAQSMLWFQNITIKAQLNYLVYDKFILDPFHFITL